MNGVSKSRTLLGAMLLLGMAWAGFHQMFSVFAEYDDEGYVMLSLAQFVAGNPLYDETYTQYGPAYFFLHGALHRVLDLGVSHDVTRLKSLAQWLATACFASWFIFRMSGSQWCAVIAGLGVFFHLDKLCLEPGHPQELCALLVSILLCASAGVPSQASLGGRLRWWSLACISVVAGTLVATKINVGGLTGLAVGLALAAQLSGWTGGACFWSLALACTALPWLLCAPNLNEPNGWWLPMLVSAGCLAISLATRALLLAEPTGVSGQDDWGCSDRATGAGDTGRGAWAQLIFYGVVSLATLSGFVLAAMASGTSWSGVVYGLVGQHRRFAGSFFHAAPLNGPAAMLALGAALLCGYAALRLSRGGLAGVVPQASPAKARGPSDKVLPFSWASAVRIIYLLTPCGCLAIALLGHLFATGSPLRHGLTPRGGTPWLTTLALPLLWLILMPPRAAVSAATSARIRAQRFPRAVLGFGAVLWPLASYPTPGIQFDTMTFPLLLAALLGVYDTSSSLASTMRFPSSRVYQLATACLLCTLMLRAATYYQRRSALVPLNLPGASLLRMERSMAQRQQWVARTLRDHCDGFVFAQQGLNRFYFWTQTPPPNSLNATYWPFLLDHSQQLRVVSAARQYPRLGVVEFDYSANLPVDSPLSTYLEGDYQQTFELDGLRIKVREQ